MRDRQINKLLKIVKKGIENGFPFDEWYYKNTNLTLYGLIAKNIEELYSSNYYKLLLLDKEFAEKYFGDAEIMVTRGGIRFYVEWVYYLQQSILEDNLIDYYFKFLENENVKS